MANCVTIILSASPPKEVLGIVSERYRVAQNKDMFAFADDLIGNGQVKCAYTRRPVPCSAGGGYSYWSTRLSKKCFGRV
jgi:hypothetical protein